MDFSENGRWDALESLIIPVCGWRVVSETHRTNLRGIALNLSIKPGRRWLGLVSV